MSYDGYYHEVSKQMCEVWDTEAASAQIIESEKRVSVGWRYLRPGSSHCISVGGSYIRRPPNIVRVVQEPVMVRSGSERNTGSSSGDSRRYDKPHGRCWPDREGCGNFAFGVLGDKGSRRRGEGPRVGDCFVYNAISVEIQWRGDRARCKALTALLSGARFQAMGERGWKEDLLEPRKKITG